MYQLALFLSMLVSFSILPESNLDQNSVVNDHTDLDTAKRELEAKIFKNVEAFQGEEVTISSIEVIEIEEEVDVNISLKTDVTPNSVVKKYTDLDTEKRALEARIFSNIEAFQGEEIKISSIEIIEIEEEVDLGFDPKAHLPKNFNPYKGMSCKKTHRYANLQ